jgi:hypothetical protein
VLAAGGRPWSDSVSSTALPPAGWPSTYRRRGPGPCAPERRAPDRNACAANACHTMRVAMPTPDDVAALLALQGRSETLAEDIAAAPVRALAAAIERNDAAPAATRLPELSHWLHVLPHCRQSEIAAGGHEKRGGFLPPVALPRRMWSGGCLHWEAGNWLMMGDAATRTSRVVLVAHKSGRSGELVFVGVRHEVNNARGLARTEGTTSSTAPLPHPVRRPPRRHRPPRTPPSTARSWSAARCCCATRRRL